MTVKEAFRKNWKELIFAKILVIVEAIAIFVCGLLYANNVTAFAFAVFISAITIFAVMSNFIALILREKILTIDELEVGKRYFCKSKITSEISFNAIFILRNEDGNYIIVRAADTFVPNNNMLRVSPDKRRLEADKAILPDDDDKPIFKNRKL